PRRKMAGATIPMQGVESNGLKRVTQSQNAARLASNLDGIKVKRGSRPPRNERNGTKAHQEEPTLLCVCRAVYEEGRFMLSCDVCSGWFHPSCIGLGECSETDHA